MVRVGERVKVRDTGQTGKAIREDWRELTPHGARWVLVRFDDGGEEWIAPGSGLVRADDPGDTWRGDPGELAADRWAESHR